MPEKVSDELLRLVSRPILEPPSDTVLQTWPELWPMKYDEEEL